MSYKTILCLAMLPLLAVVEWLVVPLIFDMVRQPSDVSVLLGVGLVYAWLISHFFLVKFILKHFPK